MTIAAEFHRCSSKTTYGSYAGIALHMFRDWGSGCVGWVTCGTFRFRAWDFWKSVSPGKAQFADRLRSWVLFGSPF